MLFPRVNLGSNSKKDLSATDYMPSVRQEKYNLYVFCPFIWRLSQSWSKLVAAAPHSDKTNRLLYRQIFMHIAYYELILIAIKLFIFPSLCPSQHYVSARAAQGLISAPRPPHSRLDWGIMSKPQRLFQKQKLLWYRQIWLKNRWNVMSYLIMISEKKNYENQRSHIWLQL